MIPSVVAHQVRETILDYLRTTFASTKRERDRSSAVVGWLMIGQIRAMAYLLGFGQRVQTRN